MRLAVRPSAKTSVFASRQQGLSVATDRLLISLGKTREVPHQVQQSFIRRTRRCENLDVTDLQRLSNSAQHRDAGFSLSRLNIRQVALRGSDQISQMLDGPSARLTKLTNPIFHTSEHLRLSISWQIALCELSCLRNVSLCANFAAWNSFANTFRGTWSASRRSRRRPACPRATSARY